MTVAHRSLSHLLVACKCISADAAPDRGSKHIVTKDLYKICADNLAFEINISPELCGVTGVNVFWDGTPSCRHLAYSTQLIRCVHMMVTEACLDRWGRSPIYPFCITFDLPDWHVRAYCRPVYALLKFLTKLKMFQMN